MWGKATLSGLLERRRCPGLPVGPISLSPPDCESSAPAFDEATNEATVLLAVARPGSPDPLRNLI
jgi:hypothetical protein